jgi:hypothetical protein
MEPALADALRAIVGSGAAVVVGTRDGRLVPEVVRGWGITVADDGDAIELCIAESTGSRTLENLRDNQRIAVTLVTPTTYRSMQVKGRGQGGLVPTADDLASVERHRAAFVREVEAVGVPVALGPRFYQAELDISATLVKIRVAIDEVFDQTPGPSAGARL